MYAFLNVNASGDTPEYVRVDLVATIGESQRRNVRVTMASGEALTGTRSMPDFMAAMNNAICRLGDGA